jgi:3-dehydroquinate dehydratase / shikimate dehydrogenase
MGTAGAPLLCITVSAPSIRELVARRRAAEPLADMVELRLDGVKDIDVAAALEGRTRPAIVTVRHRSEGGRFAGSEEDRIRLLTDALGAGAEFVDVEWRTGSGALIRSQPQRTVLSLHDFDGVPDDLTQQLHAMERTGAAVLKIAVTPHRLGDLSQLLRIQTRVPDRRIVVIGMGSRGIATRVLAARFGSVWMYAGAEPDTGQLTAGELLDDFRFRSVTRDTAVYGIAGAPLAHSLSNVMHNRGFREVALDAVYLPFESEDWKEIENAAGLFAVCGLSVTAPLKNEAFRAATVSDALTRRVRAANTLKRSDSGWEARNTDVPGFMAPLAGASLRGKRATVLGAGGAARAVVAAFTDAGATVTVSARRPRCAADLASAFGVKTVEWPPPRGSWDLLVNTTPVGRAPRTDATPIEAADVGGEIVYDLNYNPPITQLLRDARAAGSRTIGGLDMLVAQAELQFEWWTGRLPRPGLFRSVALERLGVEQLRTSEEEIREKEIRTENG